MISYIKGKIIKIDEESVTIENNGIGYDIYLCENHIKRFIEGCEAFFWVYQTFSIYDGFKLYGFISKDELEVFKILLSIPNTGPKKAIEYLNKIVRSIDDFKLAIINQDQKMLKNLFGFTPKTSQKIIFSLKDKISAQVSKSFSQMDKYSNYETAINALVSLGYKLSQAKQAIDDIIYENKGKDISIEEIIKLSLKKLSS